ncbi:MAG: polyribonucleotide nucleotidyltransferase [Deltaproteobacteria bacterium RIFCSPHIGHO2_02_FULL_44_16]|nr:MAG: polyribonucleotide nucleotidyltransferase [Deltaproteobacteria bacterium RIFCSPHIGHO2_02_FULL_44_16]
MTHYIVETEIGGRKLRLETGKLARQAGGAVTVHYGDSVVLVTATVKNEESLNKSFLPLSVDFIEKTFAAGKIPGGFFKREGRPSEHATLTSRFIDRPIRPLFPDGFYQETQVLATVLSVDEQNDADVMSMIGASAALSISNAPFLGPIAGVRVGRVNGKLIVNPTPAEDEIADLDIIVAGTKDAVVMVEGGASQVSEADMIAAIIFAHEHMQPLIALQEELVRKVKPKKLEVVPPVQEKDLEMKVEEFLQGKLERAVTIPVKQERYAALDLLKSDLVATLVPVDDDGAITEKVKNIYSEVKKTFVRSMILSKHKRIDGRGLQDVRAISSEVGLLPRTHGSALFTRGETQALAVATLGTKEDQQIIDSIEGEYEKRFMLHYNFPPFSVGEVKFIRSPGRREIGHGALAERAMSRVLPSEEIFPYTIRVVSEVLESNGSSSMATVCGSTLALMDAGVPITAPVAGVAMGLIKEGNQTAILTDILGDEDHLGDMDFKVTGTQKGITALQMDMKIKGITKELLEQALSQALQARMLILEKMEETLSAPRADLSPYAPKLTRLMIPREKIGSLIGPGGKTIRMICEETGATVSVDDDGTVLIAAVDQEQGKRAVQLVKRYTLTPEVGKYYLGRVQKTVDFGAFVEVIPGTDGLIHISQMDSTRVNKVEDILKEGDEVVVKVIEIDEKSGKIRLSRKDAFGHEGEVESV